MLHTRFDIIPCLLTHQCECENTLDKTVEIVAITWRVWWVKFHLQEKKTLADCFWQLIVEHTSSLMHFKNFKNPASNYSNVHEVPSYGYESAGLKKLHWWCGLCVSPHMVSIWKLIFWYFYLLSESTWNSKSCKLYQACSQRCCWI